ncbi:MAG: murein hydrolase activator EnvC family protein [Desulforhopalus sp.]
MISRQETKIEEAKKEEQQILVELEGLDKNLKTQEEKLEELNAKIQRQQLLIEKEEFTLLQIRLNKSSVEEHLMKRINAYYTMGDIGFINVTFSTQRFPELLRFHDAFDRLLKYDQKVLKEYQTALKDVVRVKKALDLEKTVLEDFLQQTTLEKERLEDIKNEKNRLLTHIRTQNILHQQAIKEMLLASEELSKSILEIKSKNQVNENAFLLRKGKLVPPVEGTLVTLFNQEKVNKLGVSRLSQGIELQATDGTSVYSVFDGEVIFSGYLRGYGNTIIIHHGFQYYTLTARVENTLVSKGQKLPKGTNLGKVGAAATLFDEGLYFEVRHGQQSLDPLLWLDPERLSPAIRN